MKATAAKLNWDHGTINFKDFKISATPETHGRYLINYTLTNSKNNTKMELWPHGKMSINAEDEIRTYPIADGTPDYCIFLGKEVKTMFLGKFITDAGKTKSVEYETFMDGLEAYLTHEDIRPHITRQKKTKIQNQTRKNTAKVALFREPIGWEKHTTHTQAPTFNHDEIDNIGGFRSYQAAYGYIKRMSRVDATDKNYENKMLVFDAVEKNAGMWIIHKLRWMDETLAKKEIENVKEYTKYLKTVKKNKPAKKKKTLYTPMITWRDRSQNVGTFKTIEDAEAYLDAQRDRVDRAEIASNGGPGWWRRYEHLYLTCDGIFEAKGGWNIVNLAWRPERVEYSRF